MRRLLTSPRWIVFHLGALVLIGLELRLGLWQWHRAEGTGGLQNLGYAIQWPLFSGFTGYLWWRTCREELDPSRRTPKLEQSSGRPVHRITTADIDDSDDPELAAYNARLAALAEGKHR